MSQDVSRLFLHHSSRKLRQMSEIIETCLAALTDEQIWWREGEQENAVGNLVLHLCGNLRQWIGSAIAGEGDIRQREAEFAARGGLGRHELLALVRQTTDQSASIIDALNPARLAECIETQDGSRSILETVYQVVGHFQQHTGQIIFATKRCTGRDLQLYVPHPKP